MADEKFNDVEPLVFEGSDLANIENDPKYGKYLGNVWVDHNWLNVAEARALRDWLNKALP